MPHFAKIDSETKKVVFVTVGRDLDEGKENELIAENGYFYKQTSYNTKGGVHYDPETQEMSADQTKAFRFNYAGIGYTYDETIGTDGAFIPPKPFESWQLDENCLWQPPIPMPTDRGICEWNEQLGQWDEVA